MFKIVRNDEGAQRQMESSRIVNNLITKEISKELSLAIVDASEHHSLESTKYNRIYYVLDGQLILTFGGKISRLNPGDSCFIGAGTDYEMAGTFRAIIVNQPAFGTIDLS